MLTGTLVTLRAIEPGDYPRLNSWANDIEMELLGGGDPPAPTPQASTAALFERLRADSGSVNFAITAAGADGEKLIGQCGLFHQDAVARTAELGITIGDRAYLGRGYGRDALRVLLDYGFRLRNLRRIWLNVHATNGRAIRAYAAVGFVEEGRMREHVWCDGGYVDLVQMGLLRRDWAQPQEPGKAQPPLPTEQSRQGQAPLQGGESRRPRESSG